MGAHPSRTSSPKKDRVIAVATRRPKRGSEAICTQDRSLTKPDTPFKIPKKEKSADRDHEEREDGRKIEEQSKNEDIAFYETTTDKTCVVNDTLTKTRRQSIKSMQSFEKQLDEIDNRTKETEKRLNEEEDDGIFQVNNSS